MAITLRNKVVEQKIREIGRLTGEGPSAVIARLVAAEHPRANEVSEEEAERRLAEMMAYLDTIPKPSNEEREAMQRAMDEMYDEFGLPK